MGAGDFMGFGLILAGLWIIDSAIKGRGPLSSLKGILSSKPGTAGANPSSYNGLLPGVVINDGDAAASELEATQGSTGNVTAGASSSPVVQKAVNYALAQVGKPYKWGATGPDSFDCSGLCMKAYAAAGIQIGRVTQQQILDGTKVTGALLPGDLVFPDAGHVEMVINSTQTVQAPHTGAFVEVSTIPTYIAARRIVTAGNSEPARIT